MTHPAEAAPKLSALRRRLGRFRRTRMAVRATDQRVARLRKDHAALRKQVDAQVKQIEALRQAGAKAKPIGEDELRYVVVDHGRLTAQVAALEERAARLEREHAPEIVIPGDGAAVAEARSLVDAIRREHEQVRARLQIIAQYEERLRRVEEAILAIDDSDVRRMV